MKTVAATTLSLAALASAAAPETAFNFNWLHAGYSVGCRGADTLDVKVTPEAISWDLQDYSAKHPDVNTLTHCVMNNDIHRAPGNWRFAFDSATYKGNAKLSGGARVGSLGTYLDMYASYVTNQPVPEDKAEWARRLNHLSDFVVTNTTLDADESGNFEVTAKPSGDGWSPCFFSNSSTGTFKFEISHQTILSFEEEAGGEAEFGPGLKVDLKLKWEECEPSLAAMGEYGRNVDVPEGWKPYA